MPPLPGLLPALAARLTATVIIEKLRRVSDGLGLMVKDDDGLGIILPRGGRGGEIWTAAFHARTIAAYETIFRDSVERLWTPVLHGGEGGIWTAARRRLTLKHVCGEKRW